MPPEALHFNDRDRLIELQSWGGVDAVTIGDSIAKIIAMGEEHGVYRVLIDARKVSGLPSTDSMFGLFAEVPREFVVAILADAGQPTAGDLRFIETIARNRAKPVRIFHNRARALAWLNEISNPSGAAP